MVNGSNTDVAFRWTHATGMVTLGFPAGGRLSVGSGVSADGSVITGWNDNGAFRWTAATGMVNIGNLGGDTLAYGMSADGSVIVGVDESPTRFEPFRWAADGGMIGLGTLGGLQPNYSRAQAVSSDGSVVVGWGSLAPAGDEAFRWTSATGMVPLGWLSSMSPFGSYASSTSTDGSIVVGYSYIGYNPTVGLTSEAFRWTEASGMVGLGTLPGARNSYAGAITPDGSIIVGSSGGNITTPFIWTDATGMVSLADILTGARRHGL